MAEMEQTLQEIRSHVQRMGEEYPRQFGVFSTLKRRVEEEGALSTRVKKLIGVALAVVSGCEWCIALHVREALDEGATRDELMEACFVAMLMGGGPAMAHGRLALRAIEEFFS